MLIIKKYQKIRNRKKGIVVTLVSSISTSCVVYDISAAKYFKLYVYTNETKISPQECYEMPPLKGRKIPKILGPCHRTRALRHPKRYFQGEFYRESYGEIYSRRKYHRISRRPKNIRPKGLKNPLHESIRSKVEFFKKAVILFSLDVNINVSEGYDQITQLWISKMLKKKYRKLKKDERYVKVALLLYTTYRAIRREVYPTGDPRREYWAIMSYYCIYYASLWMFLFGFFILRPYFSAIWLWYLSYMFFTGFGHKFRTETVAFMSFILLYPLFVHRLWVITQKEENLHAKKPELFFFSFVITILTLFVLWLIAPPVLIKLYYCYQLWRINEIEQAVWCFITIFFPTVQHLYNFFFCIISFLSFQLFKKIEIMVLNITIFLLTDLLKKFRHNKRKHFKKRTRRIYTLSSVGKSNSFLN